MTTREAAGTLNAIRCSSVTTPSEHEALVIAERVLLGVEPVKRGKWENYYYRTTSELFVDVFLRCSECGDIQLLQMNYCPNCGAKMERRRTKDSEMDQSTMGPVNP